MMRHDSSSPEPRKAAVVWQKSWNFLRFIKTADVLQSTLGMVEIPPVRALGLACKPFLVAGNPESGMLEPLPTMATVAWPNVTQRPLFDAEHRAVPTLVDSPPSGERADAGVPAAWQSDGIQHCPTIRCSPA